MKILMSIDDMLSSINVYDDLWILFLKKVKKIEKVGGAKKVKKIEKIGVPKKVKKIDFFS